ncbi:MAG: PorT family protein [Prevotella sp.]|nr:PorT family protein [Prevotella sp.]
MSNIKRITIAFLLLMVLTEQANAQIGLHRSDFAVGVNAGYVLSNVGFTPTVSQSMHGGVTGGFTARYVCEKYYSSICSVQAEVNFASIGWKENILDKYDQPVINASTGVAEEYSRTINYVQIPIFAHLGWGREQKGAQFFFQAGPQFGFYLSESTSANFNTNEPNLDDRANQIHAQYDMPVEHKFDYGIAAGLGMEYSVPGAGHFMIEGRYYYGLGNIYGDTKKDYFGKSNIGNIVIKLSYLFDITKTKQ